MPRDTEFASEARINASIKVFINQHIPYAKYAIGPIPVTPLTFQQRIPTITRDVSQYLFYRFQQNKWLDSDNGLLYNPRRKDTWKVFLFPSAINTTDGTLLLKNLKKHENIIPDFLNTLYGEHEISFEHSYEALKWHQETYQNQMMNSNS